MYEIDLSFWIHDWTRKLGAAWCYSLFNMIVHEYCHSQCAKPCLYTLYSAFLRCVSIKGSEEAMHMPAPCSEAGCQSIPHCKWEKSCWQRLEQGCKLWVCKMVTSVHVRERCLFSHHFMIYFLYFAKARWVVIVLFCILFWHLFWFVKIAVKILC